MNGRTLLYGLAVLATIVIASAAQTSKPESQDPGAPGRPTWDSFRVLTERNIFLRDRARPSRPSRSTDDRVREVVVRDSDEDLILTGTVCQGSVAMAFIENVRIGEIERLYVGDNVGKGKITGITLDDIEYVRNGTTTKIEIGQNLRGSITITTSLPSTAATMPAENGSGESGSKPGPSPDNTSSILERMRQKRQQELNK